MPPSPSFVHALRMPSHFISRPPPHQHPGPWAGGAQPTFVPRRFALIAPATRTHPALSLFHTPRGAPESPCPPHTRSTPPPPASPRLHPTPHTPVAACHVAAAARSPPPVPARLKHCPARTPHHAPRPTPPPRPTTPTPLRLDSFALVDRQPPAAARPSTASHRGGAGAPVAGAPTRPARPRARPRPRCRRPRGAAWRGPRGRRSPDQ
jgi:hypothetical protein